MTTSETRRDKLYLSQFTRSPDWPKIRRAYLRNFDACAVCGTTKRLTAHHILPFHLFPQSELDMRNLIALCETHHLLFGHLNDFKSVNKDVVTDSMLWRARIRGRPNKMRYAKK